MSTPSYPTSPPSTAYSGLPGPAIDTAQLIKNISPQRARYDDAIRMQALAIYAETGNQREVERQIGIPRRTVGDWVNDADTPRLLDELRTTVRYREGWRVTNLVSKSLDRLEEALDKGVPHVTRSGQVIYTPQSPKDAAVTASILIDKQVLISGTLTQSNGILQEIAGLGRQLADLGAQLTAGPLSGTAGGETSEECGKSQPPSCIDENSNGLKLSDIGG